MKRNRNDRSHWSVDGGFTEKEIAMEDNNSTEVSYQPQDHPWVEMPADDSVDEEIRYSLDEIRVG